MEKSHFELLAIESTSFVLLSGQSVALTLVHTAYPFAFSFNLYGTLVFQSLLLLFYIASYCCCYTSLKLDYWNIVSICINPMNFCCIFLY
jgi:hypothetical protein